MIQFNHRECRFGTHGYKPGGRDGREDRNDKLCKICQEKVAGEVAKAIQPLSEPRRR